MLRIYLIFFLLLSGCGPAPQESLRDTDSIIRLTESDARGLDPQIVSDLSSTRIAQDQFEGLTRFNGAGLAEPGLAESWEISDDGIQWTFTLRPLLKFSDEAPITTDVFTKAIARIREEKSGSPHSSLFAVIKSIKPIDARRLKVILANPFPALPALLAHPAMAALPFHRIDKAGEAWTEDRPLVTSGPYRLTDWRLNQRLTLSQNPHWHDGSAPTSKIIWQPMDNVQSGMRLMLAGGADISTEYPSSRHAWLKQNYPKLVHGSDFLATYYFAFNTRRPPFNDIRVRLALAGAIDRRWIADKMVAAGNEPAWGLLPGSLRPPSEFGISNVSFQPAWRNDPRSELLQKSRDFLAQAGYGPKNPLSFEIRFNSSAEHRRAAVAMATMWREIGVEAKLLNSESSLHFDSLKRGDFDLARSGWVADFPAPENFLAVHRSDAGAQNYSGYTNPKYDKALDIALAEPIPAKRAEKMRQAEMILIADMPILPLYFYVSRALVNPRITGWQDNIANVHPSRTLAIRRP
jgi:oligopeptide transport system substrate-binding protein